VAGRNAFCPAFPPQVTLRDSGKQNERLCDFANPASLFRRHPFRQEITHERLLRVPSIGAESIMPTSCGGIDQHQNSVMMQNPASYLGTDKVILVPSPRQLERSNVAPILSARSLRFLNPNPPLTSLTSNPIPLSQTDNTNIPF
jgi:hypothetical protein